jgi:hypothetical protein
VTLRDPMGRAAQNSGDSTPDGARPDEARRIIDVRGDSTHAQQLAGQTGYGRAGYSPQAPFNQQMATQPIQIPQLGSPQLSRHDAEMLPTTGGSQDDDPPAGSWTGPLVRAGIRPMLVLLDLVACLAGALASGGVRPIMGLFTLLLIAAYATGGLYRSRLSPSILDDLPALAGRLLVVLARTVTGQLTLNQLRWDV